ncbi:MAG: ATP-binding protein [Desulfobaccales bacterium]
MSIRTKLIWVFGGIILILAMVALVTFHTLTESSRVIDRMMRENYDSVEACYKMKDASERLDHLAEVSLWEKPPDWQRQNDEVISELERNLKLQQGNVTLPGEQELTDRLTELWLSYHRELTGFYQLVNSGAPLQDLYRNTLLPRSQAFRDTAQRILELNLKNMVAADGQAHLKAVHTRNIMLLLLSSGILVALGVIVSMGPNIWGPITRLTQSVSEIQKGNLDLVVKATSRDEIGQLAEAFNKMTATLREVRRSDRAQLLRTQKSTLLALNSLRDAVAICDLGGKIELANEVARRLFGLNPEATLTEVGNEKLIQLFQKATQEERPILPKGYDTAIQIFLEEEEHFFLPEAIPIFDEERHLMGVTLMLAEVTRLRRLDEVKNGLISTVSHELKTPLTSVRLGVHLLLSEKIGPLSVKQAEVLEAARQDSDRLYRVIEDLLDISRIESGSAEMQLETVNVEALVLQVTEKVRPAFKDHGIALSLEAPSEAPAVLADPQRLPLVFDNLLSNALKYTPRGGRVRVSARTAEGMVQFLVEDTGIGIAPEYLPRLFEKFFRVPGQDQVDSGLGLTIAKEIVVAHGGRIEVASEPKKGTKFTFTVRAA